MDKSISIPRCPYTRAEIASFFEARVRSPRSQIRVLFMSESLRPSSRPSSGDFKIECEVYTKKSPLPAFLEFEKAHVLADDVDSRDGVIAKLQGTADCFLNAIDSHSSFARENRARFEEVIRRPALLYNRLKVRALADKGENFLSDLSIKAAEGDISKFQALPAWMQIMMIESNTAYRVGYFHIDAGNCHSHGNGLRDFLDKFVIGGVFNSRHDCLASPNEASPLWVDKVSVVGKNFGGILFHEEGHKLSYYAAQFAKLSKSGTSNLASEHIAWKDAVAETKKRTTIRNIPLKVHFLLYAEGDECEEALAEMVRLYASNFIKYRGDNNKIEEVLGEAYPILLPVFRGVMIPQFVEMASRAYGEKLNPNANSIRNAIT